MKFNSQKRNLIKQLKFDNKVLLDKQFYFALWKL